LRVSLPTGKYEDQKVPGGHYWSKIKSASLLMYDGKLSLQLLYLKSIYIFEGPQTCCIGKNVADKVLQ